MGKSPDPNETEPYPKTLAPGWIRKWGSGQTIAEAAAMAFLMEADQVMLKALPLCTMTIEP